MVCKKHFLIINRQIMNIIILIVSVEFIHNFFILKEIKSLMSYLVSNSLPMRFTTAVEYFKTFLMSSSFRTSISCQKLHKYVKKKSNGKICTNNFHDHLVKNLKLRFLLYNFFKKNTKTKEIVNHCL